MTDFIFKKLAEPRRHPRYRWDALLNPEPAQTSAVASGIEQHGRTIVPKVDSATKPTETSIKVKQRANAASATFESKPAIDSGAKAHTDQVPQRSLRRAKSETTGKTTGQKGGKNTATPRSKTTL
jgi:hypothetical protein